MPTAARIATAHKIPGLERFATNFTRIVVPKDDNADVSIKSLDAAGVNGANNQYEVTGRGKTTTIDFADVTNESLIAVVIDRLQAFQGAPLSSPYYENAINSLKDALGWLQKRTVDRMRRGVEGTNAP